MAQRAEARRICVRSGAAAVAVAALLAATPASAALTCTITANPVSFGAYNGVTKAVVNKTVTFSLNCTGTGTLTYTITLSPGQSGVATARYMLSGSNRLNYQIYKDSARTQVFGDGAGGTTDFSGSINVSSSPYAASGTIYPTVPAGQAAVPGSYTDTLTLLLTY